MECSLFPTMAKPSMVPPTKPFKFCFHPVLGSIFTINRPEINAGNTEVNKIVLGIRKSRQNRGLVRNTHRVYRICLG